MWILASLFVGTLIGANYLEKHKKSIYKDHMAVRLAKACRNGDVSAMRKMAELLRRHCEAEMKELLDQYESDPTPEHASEVRRKRTCMGEAYMMWLVRAALYGDTEADEKLDKYPIYKELAFIPYNMMFGEEKPHITFWNSSILYDIGFIDVPKGFTDCRLLYDADKRIFNLCYVSDYEPPDEDGFGAEWTYDNICFDEFFRRLPKEN